MISHAAAQRRDETCRNAAARCAVAPPREKTSCWPQRKMNNRPLFIPVILGTVRKGRASENVAMFVFEQVKQREGVETQLIDIRELKFPGDDAGEQIKDQAFSALCERADG